MMQPNEIHELDAALRLRFDLFLMRCFLTVNPGAIFMDNWHIDHMAYYAERIANGEVHRLIVNMPPRNLKSLAFNVALTAFLLGHDPRKRIFCISYGADLRPNIPRNSRPASNRSGISEFFRACASGAWSMSQGISRWRWWWSCRRCRSQPHCRSRFHQPAAR